MNTSLAIVTRNHLEEITTDYSYLDVFPGGILRAGAEILRNNDMTTMAKKAIYQVGLYQGRTAFILHDLHMEMSTLDMKYKLDGGDLSDFEKEVSEDEMRHLKLIFNDLREWRPGDTMLYDSYLIDAMQTLYLKAWRNLDPKVVSSSMMAICRIALSMGYRIIMDHEDLNSFGSGIFSDIFELDSPADQKSQAICSMGMSFKVTLNDAQRVLHQSEPITERIHIAFPEAETVCLKVGEKLYREVYV